MKTAIVTGASGNLGQAVVRRLLADDYRVTGTVIPGDPLNPDFGDSRVNLVPVDLTDEKAAAAFVEQIIREKGVIDTAVLTVGGFAMGGIAETDLAQVQKQILLNVATTWTMARPVFLQMKKQGQGRIFMIGSKPGLDMTASGGKVAYGMAKSLIFRMAELMNEEAKGTNVVTGVIVPSTIDTPQNRESMPGADFTKWVTPEAIADVIAFYSGPGAAILREPVIKVYGNA